MATRCIVLDYTNMVPTSDTAYTLSIRFALVDINGGVSAIFEPNVDLLWADTLAQVTTKIVTAVVNYASRQGFTVPRTSVFVPTYQQGA